MMATVKKTVESIKFVMIIVTCYLCPISCDLVAFPIIGKPTAQSTTYGSLYTADKAVDGILSSHTHTATDGKFDPHPWWRVDLGGEHCMGRVTVTLRTNCCGPRYIGAIARAGISSNPTDNQQCGTPASSAQSYTGAVIAYLCDTPVMARYVSLDIDLSIPEVTVGVLQLAEVTVEVHSTNTECTVSPTTPGVTVSTQPSTESTTVEEQTTQSSAEVCPNMNKANFRRLYKGAAIGNPDPLSTKRASSLLRCAAYCIHHAHCFIFDFSPKTVNVVSTTRARLT